MFGGRGSGLIASLENDVLAAMTGGLSTGSILGVELALEGADGPLLEVSDGADESTSIR